MVITLDTLNLSAPKWAIWTIWEGQRTKAPPWTSAIVRAGAVGYQGPCPPEPCCLQSRPVKNIGWCCFRHLPKSDLIRENATAGRGLHQGTLEHCLKPARTILLRTTTFTSTSTTTSSSSSSSSFLLLHQQSVMCLSMWDRSWSARFAMTVP